MVKLDDCLVSQFLDTVPIKIIRSTYTGLPSSSAPLVSPITFFYRRYEVI